MPTNSTLPVDNKIIGKSIGRRFGVSWLFMTINLLLSTWVLADGLGQTQQNPNNPNGPQNPAQCNASGNGGAGGGASAGPSACSQCKKPVSVNLGYEIYQTTDLVLNGVYPITISRRYNSIATYDSPLGYGWAFDHSRRLYEYPDNSIVIRFRCGARDKFVYTGDAYTASNIGMRGRLQEQSDGSYIYQYIDGTRDYFSSEGLLTAAEDIYGHRLEYLYSSDKQALVGTSPYAIDPNKPAVIARTFQLQRIQERLVDGSLTGNFVNFSYSPTTGRVTQLTTSDGRTIHYEHDVVAIENEEDLTLGNLVRVRGLENLVHTYAYNDPLDPHNITSFQEGEGTEPYINVYDSDDRVISQTHGDSYTEFSYVVDYLETHLIDRIGFDELGEAVTATTKFRFTEAGYTHEIENALGELMRNTFDSRNLITRVEYFSVADTQGRRQLIKARNYSYNIDQRLQSESTVLKNGEIITRQLTYDHGWIASESLVSSAAPTQVFRTEYIFNYTGGIPRTIKEIRRYSTDNDAIVTQLKYNARNQLTQVVFANSEAYEYVYDQNSLYPTQTYWRDSSGQIVPTQRAHYTYDAQGNIASVRDARGHTTQLTYDSADRLLSLTNPLNEITRLSYDSQKLLGIEHGRIETTDVTHSGRRIHLAYDNKNRVERIEQEGDNNARLLLQQYTYGLRNEIVQSTATSGVVSQYTYDALNRLSTMTEAGVLVQKLSYDQASRVASHEDSLGRIVRYEYDARDRIIGIYDQGLNPASHTQIAYNALDQISAITDPLGNRTQYTYDRLGRASGVIHPMLQQESYRYDDRDRLVEHIGFRGQRSLYRYHPWGGLEEADLFASSSATAAERQQHWRYDLQGNVTEHIDTAVAPTALESYSFDALNRLASTTAHYIPGDDKVVSMTYDRFGNISEKRLIDASRPDIVHSFGYDQYNRLDNATLAGRSFHMGYNPNNQMDNLSYPSNSQLTMAYNPRGLLEQLRVDQGIANNLVDQKTYTYDSNINVKNIQHNTAAHNGNYTYVYDALNRLTSASYPAVGNLPSQQSFAYDAVGNREQVGNPDANHYNGNNQLSSLNNNAQSFTYDDAGNLTARTWANDAAQNQSWVYDHFDRPVHITSANLDARYSYTSDGRRLSKTVNGTTTYYLWDGTQLIAEYQNLDNQWQQTRRYDYLPDATTPQQMVDTTGVYTIISDHLDTPSLMLNDQNQVVWRQYATAFGEASIDDDVDGDGTHVTMNFRFPGQYFDQETGTHYNYFRTYDPRLGRYLQSDPLGQVDGPNTYLYARNNPLGYADPYGLFCLGPVAIATISGAVGGGITGLSGGLLGAGAGFVVGGVAGGVGAYINSGAPSSVATGTVAGALGAATPKRYGGSGAGLPGILGGAIGGMVGAGFASGNGVSPNAAGGLIGGFTGAAFARVLGAGGSQRFLSTLGKASVLGALGGLVQDALHFTLTNTLGCNNHGSCQRPSLP
ncbi:RHS repeat-associated core domain-containing protein [Agarilytica rhodophyticola]|uniref:RHS repeat-associated core domain-containing protein n=1 Tax=Agarilytica rhodophyticola TaxID=1737490 RepID=UPI0013156345|nr:RHS repeat-associated core domain-containing protein [Agarilytica rhodophyticola]